ncbi:hypothetical protein [uncultured Nostoc sp.]|uniref:hypothetical protein n=1 Tax=uncultured Nostoc sp. TaxID=340711 RepID=UPI0035CB2128
MKKLLSLILLGLFPVGFVLSPLKPAAAYCVYNDSDQDITALQLPVKPDSFKKVIGPKNKECCNFSETSCLTTATDGPEGLTKFAVYKGNFNTSAITAQTIFEKIATILAGSIPIIGASAQPAADEIFKALDEYIPESAKINTVVTYNGGVVVYKGGVDLFGCWTGSCIGQDVNGDGTKGVPK